MLVKNFKYSNRGFALVISLALMSFVVMLLLSITTLVRVETQSSSQQLKKTEAYNVALLGVMQAIGELQQTMGPDQRVSATADVLADRDDTRKNLVGVWSTAASDVSYNGQNYAQGGLLRWLTSDSSDEDFHKDVAVSPDGVDVMPLLWGGTLRDSNGDGVPDDPESGVVVDIRERLVRQENGAVSGRFGWWIGDEGVKARVNLERPSASASSNLKELKQRALLEVSSPSVAKVEVLDELEGIGGFVENIDRIVEVTSLGMLDDSAATSDDVGGQYFHDLTTYSAGVLADVKNGGLKQDLSLAFEMSDADFASSSFAAAGEEPIEAVGFGQVQPVFQFTANTAPSGTSGGGPSFSGKAHGPVWNLLRDYYRLYHEIENPMTAPTLHARAFGPSAHHGDSQFQSLGTISGTNTEIDQQPAILFAGGKTKFFPEQGFTQSGLMRDGQSRILSTDQGQNNNVSANDFQHVATDPIRIGEVGDPLRGGGKSENGTTMPVMVTGTYMPYLLRYVMEVGVYLDDQNTLGAEPDGSIIYEDVDGNTKTLQDPVVVRSANRERFMLHNPYNVTLKHDEIAIDAYGKEVTFQAFDGNNRIDLPYYSSGNDEWKERDDSASFQFESKRQIRVRASDAGGSSFVPGEIKTFMAGGYSVGNTPAYAPEGFEEDSWHHHKWGDGANDVDVGAIERPALGGSVDLYLYGVPPKTVNALPGWDDRSRYLSMRVLFLTHLKQAGNDAFGWKAIRDDWPMTSVIDTAVLLPGYEVAGPATSSYNKGVPGNAHRFFPGGHDPFAITDTLIDQFSGMSLSQKRQISKPVAVIDLQLKPSEYSVNTDVRYPAFMRSNPLAPVRDNKNLLPSDDLIENSVGFPTFSPDIDFTIADTGTSGLAQDLEEWGSATGDLSGSGGGVSNPVLLEIPTAPILSLGKLQHANLGIYAHMPALAVGNSLASTYIDPSQVYTVFKNRYDKERVFYDLSYLMNEALWDGYFFSSYSLPYDAANDDFDQASDTVSETFDAAFISESQSLPNSRMRLVNTASETLQDIRDKLFTGTTIRSQAPRRAAENLLVAGSFNVNSTSVSAWRAVLSGARDVAVYESGETNATSLANGSSPFPRMLQPTAGEFDGSDSSETAWAGFRTLSDSQIERLATEIVKEIKRRVADSGAPFLSLADFVNRGLDSSEDDIRRSGLLQAAIDQSGINDELRSGASGISESSLSNSDKGEFPFAENAAEADGDPASAMSSAPTYLMQADVLQAIGSFISVRSDTYRIRTYGESLDPLSGEKMAGVWLEAIVQRVPEPVSPEDGVSPDLYEYWDGLDAAGEPDEKGRRFRIISLRELTKEEV